MNDIEWHYTGYSKSGRDNGGLLGEWGDQYDKKKLITNYVAVRGRFLGCMYTVLRIMF